MLSGINQIHTLKYHTYHSFKEGKVQSAKYRMDRRTTGWTSCQWEGVQETEGRREEREGKEGDAGRLQTYHAEVPMSTTNVNIVCISTS